MNENYIKEYEEMSLCDFADELVEPLCIIKKDLTKAIYIRYAEERDKNDELEKENARLKDKIEKVIEYANSDEFEQLFESCDNFNEANCNINHFLKEN